MTRRWNGWGDDGTHYPLTPDALNFIEARIGAPTFQPVEPSYDAVAATVPESKLDLGDIASADPGVRMEHSRGQSFPDWLAMKFGNMGPYPDLVAMPESREDVASVMKAAEQAGAWVSPWGGGTSVVGHHAIPNGDRPVVCLSLERMNRLIDLNVQSRLARFGAGVAGPHLEAQLAAHGYTLGHFPQSFELSTLGGWVVTRSSGQQSLRYGRIEQLFAGGHLRLASGEEMVLPTIPASSAGPDMREFVLGSEGRTGVLTEAWVRVSPKPDVDDFHGVFFPDWESGAAAVRELVQARVPLSMLRLSNEIETETQLALAGKAIIEWLEKYLKVRGLGTEKCMLMVGVTGNRRQAKQNLAAARSIWRQHGGIAIGRPLGNTWRKNRFHSPYLRNELWEAGYAVDTIETCVDWPRATEMMRAMESAAKSSFEEQNERVHAFTHLSHVYAQGCSVYSTFLFRAADSVEGNMQRWQALKSRVTDEVVRLGGTVSHQHGVGVDHAPWLPAEKGEVGMNWIRGLIEQSDPNGLMKPGNLFGSGQGPGFAEAASNKT